MPPGADFLASGDDAESCLDAHPQVRGQVITMPEAILAAHAVFGDVLEED